jgi:hypothetical protein
MSVVRSSKPHRSRCTDAAVAWVVMFFVLLFAMWTLACHAATFGGIPWRVLSTTSTFVGLPVALLAAWGARRFAVAWTEEVEQIVPPVGLQGTVPVVLFLALTALLLITPVYGLRVGIALLAFASMWWLTRRGYQLTEVTGAASPADATFLPRHAAWLLAFCALVAVVITLTSHRSDLDDSNFIQIAAQTLRFPERAPLTFDASLGVVTEPFRFAPYRLASYETLIALLAGWTGLDLLTVYYLLLPGITAALTVGVAFLLARWFLPCGLAVAAVVVFVLIMLAWGETHVAYGNRVFVRLFQGKGLLIALATPITLIAGLMLLRRPSVWNWTFLALAQVAAIGVSSSGLVCTFVTTALIVVMAVRSDVRAFVAMAVAIGATLVYPAVLGAWLEFAGGKLVPLSEIGTFLPINASLGLRVREALALALLVFGVAALGTSVQRREYALLVGATLVLVLNPWLAERLSGLSARNVSWRLAWAAPVPLLLAVAVAAAISPALARPAGAPSGLGAGTFAGLAAFLLFLGAARWTLAESNDVTWQWPSPKVPTEYASVREIAVVLRSRASQGSVLASSEVAAWLPLLAPDIRLVMPGHTYPGMLQTVLPPPEFADRMVLFGAINGGHVDINGIAELVGRYKVATLVVPERSNADRAIVEAIRSRTDIRAEEIGVVGGHRIMALKPTTTFP